MRVAQALQQASHDVGFLYIANYGKEPPILSEAYKQAMAFFRLPGTGKQAVVISSKHRGFRAQGVSRMHDGVLHDRKESFVWGYEDKTSHTSEGHALRGANRWPAAMPMLRRSALVDPQQVFGHVDALDHKITCGDYLEWRFGKSFDYRGKQLSADGVRA